MANIAPLDRSELPEFEEGFALIESVMGFVPRSMFTMGRKPDLLRAFQAISSAVFGNGEVDGGLKQLVAQIASMAAGCSYCQAHTASSATRFGMDPAKVAAVWEFETDDRFDSAERAALRLARDAATVPSATTPVHFAALAEHFTDDQVVELVSVISLFGWLNRWNDTMATDLEDEAADFATEHLAARGWTIGKHAG